MINVKILHWVCSTFKKFSEGVNPRDAFKLRYPGFSIEDVDFLKAIVGAIMIIMNSAVQSVALNLPNPLQSLLSFEFITHCLIILPHCYSTGLMVHHHPLLRSFPLHYHFMIVLILVGCLMFLLVDCYWLIITLLSYYSPLLFANPHCFILLPIFVHFISTSLIIPPTLEPLSFQLIFHFHLVHFPPSFFPFSWAPIPKIHRKKRKAQLWK